MARAHGLGLHTLFQRQLSPPIDMSFYMAIMIYVNLNSVQHALSHFHLIPFIPLSTFLCQPIILLLLDITPMLPVLEGVVMELQDCALPLLKGNYLKVAQKMYTIKLP